MTPSEGAPTPPRDAPARYVFRVEFRLDPATPDLSADPDTFETTLYRRADPPDEEGWRFFRDNCWRGNLADEAHFCRLATEALGVRVVSASFRELQATDDYLEDLEGAIAADLEAFNADDVTEVLSKYLGSSIRSEASD
ncbi:MULTISPECIES: LWR-salt protein [Haloarcula]|uniref:LWR-salt protein n=1 Tax=Haloarcula TaxID=2237 RepID=UPI0023EC6AF0|nr:LWR-salt protein [Halomicroarcula sp. XH51]